jgi:hypothetical protein
MTDIIRREGVKDMTDESIIVNINDCGIKEEGDNKIFFKIVKI